MSYKEIDKRNQSSLKKIIIHPQEYLKAIKNQERNDEEIPDHFVFGSVVDIMLTGNKDEFDERFIKIPDETKCSDALKPIIDSIFIAVSWKEIESLDKFPTEILEVARANNYYNNYKDDTLIATVIKQGSDYFELLKTTIGKTPITETEYAKAVNCTMAVRSNEFTQKYCKKQPDVEFWDKFIIEFKLKIEIKGELDRIIINHKDKLITPIDFKTTSKPIYSFNSEFWKFRYDFQAATYIIGLCNHPKIISLLSDGYKLDTFKYIVVEKELIHNPMVFNVPQDVIEIGIHGGERSTYNLEGLHQSIDRYKFAEKNNKWDYPMEYYQKGEIDIKI